MPFSFLFYPSDNSFSSLSFFPSPFPKVPLIKVVLAVRVDLVTLEVSAEVLVEVSEEVLSLQTLEVEALASVLASLLGLETLEVQAGKVVINLFRERRVIDLVIDL